MTYDSYKLMSDRDESPLEDDITYVYCPFCGASGEVSGDWDEHCQNCGADLHEPEDPALYDDDFYEDNAA